jgi:hypothetical protein
MGIRVGNPRIGHRVGGFSPARRHGDQLVAVGGEPPTAQERPWPGTYEESW